MIETFNERCSRLHTAIDEYIQTRLKSKLEKLEKEFDKDKSDDAAVKLTEQKNELTAKHSLRTWIGEKAGQAKQLRFATHIVYSGETGTLFRSKSA